MRKSLSKKTRQRIHACQRWTQWANRGIASLNSFYGHEHSAIFDPHCIRNAGQQRALDHMQQAYENMSRTTATYDITPAGALDALLANSGIYSDASTIRPYDRLLVAWPASSHPTPIESIMQPSDISSLGCGCEHILRSEASREALRQECNIRQPYSDPTLVGNPKEYSHFLWKMHSCGMIRWSLADGRVHTLGIFFVAKSNGMLRIIFDTRIANFDFVEPPCTALPTASALGKVESKSGKNYMATGDLECAFYNMGLPKAFSERLTLPVITAGQLGLSHVGEQAISSNVLIMPELCIIPMGWSWSLHMCQSVLNNAIEIAGVPAHRTILDGHSACVIEDRNETVAAGYVDNFAVLGPDPVRVQRQRDDIVDVLQNKFHLSCHELSPVSLDGEFVGLAFINGSEWRVKPSRVHRLRMAISHVLDRGFCSGDLMQVLVGHITWTCLLRRESLSFIQSTYVFIHKNIGKVSKIWSSVRKEISAISNLLPLLCSNMSIGWNPYVLASDASLFGIGAGEKRVDFKVIEECGRISEKWRYRAEETIRAREHALDIRDPSVEAQIMARTRGFNEVPPELSDPEGWRIFLASRVRTGPGILELEGVALHSAVKHALRRVDSFCTRQLCLLDNMSLTLAVGKGRSSAKGLTQIMRQISCLLLCSGMRLFPRWFPSERNPTDGASRGTLGFWSNRPARFPTDRPDSFGDSRRPTEHSNKLRPGLAAPGRLLPGNRPRLDEHAGARPNSSSLFQPPFRGGVWSRGGAESPIRSDPLHPRPCCTSPYKNDTIMSSFAGLEQIKTTRSETATSSSFSFRSGGGPHSGRQSCHGGVGGASFCVIHETSGNNEINAQLISGASGVGDGFLGNNSQRLLPRDSREDRSNGRIDNDFRNVPVRHFDGLENISPTGPLTVGLLYERDSNSFPIRLHAPSSYQRFKPLVRPASWWSLPRPPFSTQEHNRSAASRKVGLASLLEEVWKGEPIARRIAQSTHSSHNIRATGGSPVSQASVRRKIARSPLSAPARATTSVSSQTQSQIANCAKKAGSSLSAPTDTQIRRRLQRIFQDARRSSRRNSRAVVLDIFSGSDRLSKQLRRLGWGVISIDIKKGPHFDVTNPTVKSVLLGWISSRAVVTAWLGTPCSSFSRARHGPPGSSWQAIRSAEHLWGIPNLEGSDKGKLKAGNKLMRVSSQIMQRCYDMHIPVFLENPHTSFLWQMPLIKKFVSMPEANFRVSDACQYNARWRKRTGILALHAYHDSNLCQLCRGTGGLCSRSNKPHITLTGKDPASGLLWTRIAEPYPHKFCNMYARHIDTNIVRRRMHTYHGLIS